MWPKSPSRCKYEFHLTEARHAPPADPPPPPPGSHFPIVFRFCCRSVLPVPDLCSGGFRPNSVCEAHALHACCCVRPCVFRSHYLAPGRSCPG